MRPPEEVKRDLVRQRVARAEEDFALADHLVAENAPWVNAAAFHAQQAAEKFMKAFLVRHQIEFPKTHALGELLDIMEKVDAVLAQSLSDAIALSPFSTVTRYPGDLPEFTSGDVSKAVALAAKVRNSIGDSLRSYLAEGEA